MSELTPNPQVTDGDVPGLLGSAPFGLLVASPEGKITAMNEAAAEHLGLSINERSGPFLVDLLADSGESPLLDDMLRTALAGDQVRRSFQISASGVLRVINFRCWSENTASGTPMVMAVVESAADDDQLHHIRALIDRSPTGMARLVGTSMTDVNSRWTEITGQAIAEASGVGWLDQIDEDGRDDFLVAVESATGRRDGIRGRLRLRTIADEIRWIEVSTTPLDMSQTVLLNFEDSTEGQDAARRADELSRVLEATRDMVGILSADGQTLAWLNDSLGELLGEAASGAAFNTYLDEPSRTTYVDTALPEVVATGSWRGDLAITDRNGQSFPVTAMFVAHYDDAGHIDAISVIARDLSDLRDAQARIAASETRMAALVEHASDMAVLVDDTGTVVYASPAVERVLGHAPGTLDGVDVLELVHPDDLELAYTTASAIAAEAGRSHAAELRIAHGDGSYRHLEVTANNLLENPAVNGIVLNATDVTDRVHATAQLAERTYHDDLTGLPNRTLLIERMHESLRRARERRLLVAVLFLDLDRFNVVNESLGHRAGDELLSEVASRIEGVIRPGDTVARLGGDEFAVVIGDMLRRGDAVIAARRLRKAITQPISVGSESAVITSSIGIAISEGVDEPENLLRDADTALHRAKTKGRDVAVVFDDHLRDQAVRRLEVENKLRRALDNDDLVVHYQPVLDTRSGKIAGAEALVRILNEDGSLVMPGEFIDVAEDSGLISQLGHQVLVKSIRQTALWTQSNIAGQDPPSIAVNVSARQLTDAAYPDLLAEELSSAGLSPNQLSLELTESALIDGNPTTERSLRQLRDLGVRIGLDDFGTGFSSLAYLKRFPISFLKVDKSFVGGLGTDENDSAIVR
ncbi:MAG: EAL domain-containing protein, partial [Acidimicrobiales bacterium]